MSRIVAVCRDLRSDTVSPVTRGHCHPLPLRAIRAIRQDIGDYLKSARVAETSENERHVSSHMPVLVIQPVCQWKEHAGVVPFHNLLGRRELSPKCLLT